MDMDTLANLVLRWRQLASEFDDKVTRDMAAELNQWLIGIAEGYDRAADELEAVMNAGAGA